MLVFNSESVQLLKGKEDVFPQCVATEFWTYTHKEDITVIKSGCNKGVNESLCNSAGRDRHSLEILRRLNKVVSVIF